MKLDKYTVGKRYGKALFELAVEKKATDFVYQDLLVLRKVFQEVPNLGAILSDVRLSGAEKDAIITTITDRFEGLVKNFLKVVFDYNRIDDLPLIIDEYENRYNELNKIVLGTLTTAVPVSDDQKAKIEAQIADTFGYKTAELTPEVDPSIVGGVIVEANHEVIDGSLASQLNGLRAALSKK